MSAWFDVYPDGMHPVEEYDRILNDLSEAKAEDGGLGIHKYCRKFRLARGRPLIRKLDELWKMLTPQEKREREDWRP